MNPILAIQADPIETLLPLFDSTLMLALEGQKRGYRPFFYTPQHLVFQEESFRAQGAFCDLTLNGDSIQAVVLESVILDLATSDILLIRQDPPFDASYLANTYLLELLAKKIKVLNHPKGIREACEKTLPLHFPNLIPPTVITADAKALFEFSKHYSHCVLKPLFSHGGHGVLELQNPSLSSLKTLVVLYQKTYGGPVLMQPFLPEVMEGDKRLILVDGKLVGGFKRIPQKGEIRSNLVQGGVPERCEITKQDHEICEAISPLLKSYGLFLVGVDVIGGYLMEINVTSPTGLRALKRLEGVDVAEVFWDSL